MKHLTRRTAQNKYLFIGELLAGGRDFKPKMVCLKKFPIVIFVYNFYKCFNIFSFGVCGISINLNFVLFHFNKKYKGRRPGGHSLGFIWLRTGVDRIIRM